MKIQNWTEYEDGSALLSLDLSPEEIQALIQAAVTIGLTEGLKLVEKERIKECLESAQSTSNT